MFVCIWSVFIKSCWCGEFPWPVFSGVDQSTGVRSVSAPEWPGGNHQVVSSDQSNQWQQYSSILTTTQLYNLLKTRAQTLHSHHLIYWLILDISNLYQIVVLAQLYLSRIRDSPLGWFNRVLRINFDTVQCQWSQASQWWWSLHWSLMMKWRVLRVFVVLPAWCEPVVLTPILTLLLQFAYWDTAESQLRLHSDWAELVMSGSSMEHPGTGEQDMCPSLHDPWSSSLPSHTSHVFILASSP